MTTEFKCILCMCQLTVQNGALEHVIPNALGGRLKTYNATCTSCNSKVGASVENHLISSMAYLANALDVPRDRGVHPDIYFRDETTGLEYRIPAGSDPTLAPNVKVDPSDGRVSFSFFAPTRQEAERFLKNQLLKSKKKRMESENLSGEPREGDRYDFKRYFFSYDNPQHLRAIAKIALSFARQRDVATSRTPLAERFLRGENVSLIPVAPVAGDVIAFEEALQFPLYHGIYLFKPATSAQLFAYVVLFEILEFIVLIDETSPLSELCTGYLYNLVTAKSEERRFSWVASPEMLLNRLGVTQPSVDRMKQRSLGLNYWLTHRTALWFERAMAGAVDVYFALLNKGSDEMAAQQAAEVEAKRIGAAYGISVSEFGIRKQDR